MTRRTTTRTVRSNRRRAAIATLTLGLTFGPVIGVARSVEAARASINVVGLAPGATGEDVKALQQALIAAGVPVRGGADGVYGTATAAAVAAFQQARGLPATGSVDSATATALGLGPSPVVGLARGARGDLVKRLQQTLINLGVTVAGGVDGVYGNGTAAAVSAFQQSKGLPAMGSVDEATAAALGPLAPVPAAPATPAPAAPAPTPAAPAPSPLVGLRIGSTGETVKQLQQTLVNLGYNVVGGVDGVFGVATANALSQFQYAKGLKVNARVDEATAAALGTPAAAPAPAAPAPATPAPAPAPSPLVGLAPGAVGANVKALQERLIALGITVRGGADGVFGPVTANALKTFQTSQALQPTGQVDEATAAALAAPKPAAAGPTPEAAGGATGFATYGERSDRVKALQQALVNAGITLRGGVDGVFGSGTAGAVMNFQKQQGLQPTGVVDSITGQALGLAPGTAPAAPTTPAPTVTLQAFPVQGACGYIDTWRQSRGGGRTHEGTDIIAKEGQYVYAAADGRITQRYVTGTNALTGNGLKLTTADGTYFFYAHLQDVAPGIDVGVSVRAGQIIGYVGRTGNTTVSHLHFEVHPQGGAAINPFPLLKAVDACNVTTPPAQP